MGWSVAVLGFYKRARGDACFLIAINNIATYNGIHWATAIKHP